MPAPVAAPTPSPKISMEINTRVSQNGLPELDALVWRHVALHLPDPGSLAVTCRLIAQTVGSDSFRLSWFQCNHQLLAPDRPWQYAAVTWQQMRGASAGQLVQFIMDYDAFIQPQSTSQCRASGLAVDQTAQLMSTASIADTEVQGQQTSGHEAMQGAVASAATPMQGAVASAATPIKLSAQHINRRCLTAVPEHQLLPSAVCKAKQLLRKGRTLDALVQLCPSAKLLLQLYVAKARNEGIFEQLVTYTFGMDDLDLGSFPDHWIGLSQPLLQTGVACSCAALDSGDAKLLQLLLSASDVLEVRRKYLRVLRYAARHSNAACMESLLHAGATSKAAGNGVTTVVAPEHLAMAAARTDKWAPGVVTALLNALGPKQCKPSSMRPAYTAACRTCNRVVLPLLLGVAAAAPRWHLPVLLEAAAVAGNDAAWQWLLPSVDRDNRNEQMHPGCGTEHVQPPITGVQRQLQQQKLQQPSSATIDWSILPVQQLTSALHWVLPCLPERGYMPGSAQELQWDSAEQRRRLAMADVFWQQMVVGQGKEQQMRQYILEGGGWKVLMLLERDQETDTYSCSTMPDARVLWLEQHELVPVTQQVIAQASFQSAVNRAMITGDFAQALQLHERLKKQPMLQGILEDICHFSAWHAISYSLAGHMRRACASGDAEVLAQIDRLAGFNQNVFSNMQLYFHHPFLLPNIIGGFKGRAVTLDVLAVEIGLPWQLMQRLANQFFAAHLSNCMPGFWETTWRHVLKLQYHLDLSRTLAEASEYQSELLQHAASFALEQELKAQPGLSSAGVIHAAHALQALAIHQEQRRHQRSERQADARQQLAAGAQAEDAASLHGSFPKGLSSAPLVQGAADAAASSAAAEGLQANAVPVVPDIAAATVLGGPADTVSVPERVHDLYADPVAAAHEEGAVLAADGSLQVHLQFQEMHRLLAGECSIPPPEQASLGPMPLWQQCIMEVNLSTRGLYRFGKYDIDSYECMTAGMVVGGSCDALQQLLSSPVFAAAPSVAATPPKLPWGKIIAKAAIELQMPQLLEWSLRPQRRDRLWGTSTAAPLAAALVLTSAGCTPISCGTSRTPEQMQADLLQLRQFQQQQRRGQDGTRPPFAQAAAVTAVLLLQAAPNSVNGASLLSQWLKASVRPSMSETDLTSAKAVLAAVAGATKLPPGARVLEPKAMHRVLLCGDVDLFALMLCWAKRLESASH